MQMMKISAKDNEIEEVIDLKESNETNNKKTDILVLNQNFINIHKYNPMIIEDKLNNEIIDNHIDKIISCEVPTNNNTTKNTYHNHSNSESMNLQCDNSSNIRSLFKKKKILEPNTGLPQYHWNQLQENNSKIVLSLNLTISLMILPYLNHILTDPYSSFIFISFRNIINLSASCSINLHVNPRSYICLICYSH